MPRWDSRFVAAELMDDPGVPPAELREALIELDEINRLLGGHATSIAGVARLVPAGLRRVTVLDVGSGGGDGARALARWGRRRGIEVSVEGIDVSPACVDHARESAAGEDGLTFSRADLLEVEGHDRWDVVHAALVLHHFDGDAAAQALGRMVALSRLGVVINDLHRHPAAYYAIRLLARLVWRNRLIRNDGPISVLRGFSRMDLERIAAAARVPAPEITWRWAFRWQAVIRKGQFRESSPFGASQ